MNSDQKQEQVKIVLAHDSFTQFGGGERVIKAIHEVYPESPIYALATSPKVETYLDGANIKTSLLQKLYKLFPHLQMWFVFVPIVLKFFKIENTDVLLSSSSAYMKGVKKPAGSIHINYCHTPTRFLWNDVVYAEGEVHPFLRPLMRLYFWWLRRWDLRAVSKIDYFIANSKEVQNRIKRYYGRDSELIYPSVDTEFWKPTIGKQDYFLIAGRITPYKGYDTIINIFNELKLPLHVIGEGRYQDYLKSIANPNVKFYGKISDEALRDQYSGALAFIYPQVEDFGLMPLEASSCGTPTIALAKAGSLETVVEGETGELLEEFSVETLKPIIQKISAHQYHQEQMQLHAKKFSKEEFQSKIKQYVEKVTNAHHR
ncbi:MAG TPA: glycosyltransferase [Candidatus Doudnabacteria bacterium]|nr:glycosyltransferase [Candidatus Doudnabacteria bacterium]